MQLALVSKVTYTIVGTKYHEAVERPYTAHATRTDA
jgi:hypothetical protein